MPDLDPHVLEVLQAYEQGDLASVASTAER